MKMYLTGGSSILHYCDRFFEEKLGIPVEYFNPFTIVNLLPTVDRERLGEGAHMFSETIGLGPHNGSTTENDTECGCATVAHDDVYVNILHLDLLCHAISADVVHDGEPVVEYSADIYGQAGRKGQGCLDAD